MEKLEIKGRKKLSGTIAVSVSKNATLPILAATILTNKKFKPSMGDVNNRIKDNLNKYGFNV